MVTKTDDSRTPDELRAAIRSGDRTITAEQLAAAEHRVEHERLLAEADELAAVSAAEAERERSLDQLRQDIEASSANVERMRELAATATDAMVELVELARGRRVELAEFAARARKLSCPEASRGFPLEPGEVGWIKSSTGDGYSIRVGDRTLAAPDPYALADRLNVDLRARTGLQSVKPGTTNKTTPPSLDDQLGVLDRRPEPVPAPVAIRWTGGMNNGRIEHVSPSHAHHWVSRRIAEYAG